MTDPTASNQIDPKVCVGQTFKRTKLELSEEETYTRTSSPVLDVQESRSETLCRPSPWSCSVCKKIKKFASSDPKQCREENTNRFYKADQFKEKLQNKSSNSLLKFYSSIKY